MVGVDRGRRGYVLIAGVKYVAEDRDPHDIVLRRFHAFGVSLFDPPFILVVTTVKIINSAGRVTISDIAQWPTSSTPTPRGLPRWVLCQGTPK